MKRNQGIQRKRENMKHSNKLFWLILLTVVMCLTGCDSTGQNQQKNLSQTVEISGYDQEPYEIIHNNVPDFTEKEKKSTKAFEDYASLDSLGRCGAAFANICEEIMPTEKRSSIGKVKPSGWHTVKYDTVDGKYLYNRCHLIGYQLSGENANERNLITGTRYLNMEGMLPFEDRVADYVQDTGNHVLYRVTPRYEGDNLVAEGVQMEGYSVEDQGEGICFNIFAYNVQPGITIDYKTGESAQEKNGEDHQSAIVEKDKKEYKEGKSQEAESKKVSGHEQSQKEVSKGKSAAEKGTESLKKDYVLNTNTKKFHDPSCSSVEETLPKNRKKVKEDRNMLLKEGYEACQRCKP